MITITPKSYILLEDFSDIWGSKLVDSWFQWDLDNVCKRISYITSVELVRLQINALQELNLSVYLVYNEINNPVIEAIFNGQLGDVDLSKVIPVNIQAVGNWPVFEELNEPDEHIMAKWIDVCEAYNTDIEAVRLNASNTLKEAYMSAMALWIGKQPEVIRGEFQCQRSLGVEEFTFMEGPEKQGSWLFTHNAFGAAQFSLQVTDRGFRVRGFGVLKNMPALHVKAQHAEQSLWESSDARSFWQVWLENFGQSLGQVSVQKNSLSNSVINRIQHWLNEKRKPLAMSGFGSALAAGFAFFLLVDGNWQAEIDNNIHLIPDNSVMWTNNQNYLQTRSNTVPSFLSTTPNSQLSQIERQAFAYGVKYVLTRARPAVMDPSTIPGYAADLPECKQKQDCIERTGVARLAGIWSATFALSCNTNKPATEAILSQLKALPELDQAAASVLADTQLKQGISYLSSQYVSWSEGKELTIWHMCNTTITLLQYFQTVENGE